MMEELRSGNTLVKQESIWG